MRAMSALGRLARFEDGHRLLLDTLPVFRCHLLWLSTVLCLLEQGDNAFIKVRIDWQGLTSFSLTLFVLTNQGLNIRAWALIASGLDLFLDKGFERIRKGDVHGDTPSKGLP
jgi:hypothetical protein